MLNAGPFGECPSENGAGSTASACIVQSLSSCRSRFPTEDEQEGEYRAELQSPPPMPVVMRTLDIGGDGSLPFLDDEENPFLG